MSDILKRNGINSMTTNDLKHEKAYYQRAVLELMKTVYQRPKFAQEISAYRKYVPILLEYCEGIDKFNGVLNKTFERLENDSEDKHYKRWTEEEDEILIEAVCSNRSMLEVSTMMGRTVPSIKTRVSKLVGLKRLSQEIAGEFIGTLNGAEVCGHISGTVKKEIK